MTPIRWAEVDDAAELADVHVSTWQKAYADIFPARYLEGLDRSARTEWWRRFLARGARVHVAVTDRVVGFCHPDTSHDQDWGEIYAIYVHPDHWGEGHGHELLVAGESTLTSLGHGRALLWVLEANDRARRFYESHGWEPGKPMRIEEIGGVQVTELRYQKDLSAAP